MIFTAQQCLVLFKRKATVFTSSPILGYNDEDYTLNTTDGLRLAFFLFDSNSSDGIDSLGRPEEEIGTLLFLQYTDTEKRPIETHRCTSDDLDKFYNIAETQKSYEPFIRLPNLLSYCFDDEDLQIRGN